MKILIVSQHYWPENFRVTDIAENLVSLGHKVTVLCGLPNYPEGYIYDGYKHGKNRVQTHNGVNIVRVKEIGRKKSIIFRFLNYWSYPFYGCKKIKKLDKDFDVVLINETSPITVAKPGIKYGKLNKKPVVMYAMDLWPESCLAGGITTKSSIYKHYKRVSSKIYSNLDKILVSTKEHIDYIKRLPKCSSLTISYLPQYADSIFEENCYEYVDNGVIDLMFAGNIGKAQSLETIIKAASLLRNNKNIKFHIVGAGTEYSNIKKLSDELKTDNVVFYGKKPLSEMPELYKAADAMIVSLEDKSYANMTIPGKVQSYMAAGKAIIGSVNGSCANFIRNNEIGFCCSSGDSESLAKLINSLDFDTLKKIGANSRSVYMKKYSKAIFMDRLISELKILVRR